MLSNVQLLTNSTIKVAFHTPTNTIIRINDNVHNILEKYVGGVPLDDIASDLEIKKEKIAVLIAKLKDALKDKPPVKSTKTAKSIDRITLHVSNDCNLECTYCYASGGDYGEAKKPITYLTTKFGRVATLYQNQRGCTKFTVQPHTEVTGGSSKEEDL